MMTKKVCMVGAFAVGKSALLRRFVSSIFSDEYLSTVGVKISKKLIDTENGQVNLILWDLEGRDAYGDVNLNYLRGANGIILVADGTRLPTLQDAVNLRQMAFDVVGQRPCLLLINKEDLRDQWAISRQDIAKLEESGTTVLTTSAKSGNNVEKAFLQLAQHMLANP